MMQLAVAGMTKREELNILRAQLDSDRITFMDQYRDIGRYLLPSRPRFMLQQGNRGDRRNQDIIDASATFALGVSTSGFIAGMTNPAMPWFKLSLSNKALLESQDVKQWLEDVEEALSTIFLQSNIYNTLALVYRDLIAFGTAPMLLEESFSGRVIHTSSFPVGTYWIAKDHEGKVNTFMREFRMTVIQIVTKFCKRLPNGDWDLSNASEFVRDEFKNRRFQTWVTVCHVVRPNPNYNPDLLESKFKKFESCYFEIGACSVGTQSTYSLTLGDMNRYLSEKGYDIFPVLCPRWEVTAEDVYATNCPGIAATGDIKGLQHGEVRGYEAIDLMVRPPMKGPTSLKQERSATIPGSMTYVDERESSRGFTPVFEINPRIVELDQKQEAIRRRISRHFYEDLFLMFTNMQGDKTAEEVRARQAEKLLQLGPVLDQVKTDLLDPLIENTFAFAEMQGRIPVAPESLAGIDLKIEYISVLAQAQKAVALGGIEQFSLFVTNLAATFPQVLKKVDPMQMVDEYGAGLGVSARIIRSDDEVAEMEAQEAQAQAAQLQMEAINQASQAAKNLAGAKLDEDNALTRVLNSTEPGSPI